MSAYRALIHPVDAFIPHGPWGGSLQGRAWDYKPIGPIENINILYGKVIECIIFNRTICCGSMSPSQHDATISIDYPNEYLTAISGTIGSFEGFDAVMSLCFHTNRTRHGPYGSNTGTPFSYEVKANHAVVGFYGRAGKFIHAIGIYTMITKPLAPAACRGMSIMGAASSRDAGPWGAYGGEQWDDGIFSSVKQVCVYVAECSNIVYGIKFGYITNDGQFVYSQIHGQGNGVIIKEVCLDIGMDEYLTGISGFYGPFKGFIGVEGITSITFHTNKKKLGPYGDQSGRGPGYVSFTSTSSPGRIGGFHGRSTGYSLTAIGVHMQYFLNSKEEA